MNEKELKQVGEDLLADIKTYVIKDDDDREIVRGYGKMIVEQKKKVKNLFKPQLDSATETVRQIRETQKNLLTPFETGESIIRKKVNDYDNAKRKKEREEREKAQKEAERSGEAYTPPPVKKLAGTRKLWNGELTDLRAFLKYVSETGNYLDYISVTHLNDIAREVKTQVEIPGFKAEEVSTVTM